MASLSSSNSVVIDASVAIALCAKEQDKFANADTKINEYATNGHQFFAPGVIVAECLYVFCKKLRDGVITAAEHASAVQAFVALMQAINPPPSGDNALINRAEEIRGTLSCNRSADGIYLALAEELGKMTNTEVITFDSAMKSQATASSMGLNVIVLATV
jgi:predicted nucleic acid-binding protein